jgi:hypothetical protein
VEVLAARGQFDGIVVQIFYDDVTLALTRATCSGPVTEAVRVRARAVPSTGDPWSYEWTAPGDVVLTGPSYASADLDGLTIGFEYLGA